MHCAFSCLIFTDDIPTDSNTLQRSRQHPEIEKFVWNSDDISCVNTATEEKNCSDLAALSYLVEWPEALLVSKQQHPTRGKLPQRHEYQKSVILQLKRGGAYP